MFKSNKNIAIGITSVSLIFSLFLYLVFQQYFSENPIIYCGEDRYSQGCTSKVMRELGADPNEFFDCMTDMRFKDKVAANIEVAKSLGLDNTVPGMIIAQESDEGKLKGFYVGAGQSDSIDTIILAVEQVGIEEGHNRWIEYMTSYLNEVVAELIQNSNVVGTELEQLKATYAEEMQNVLLSFQIQDIDLSKANYAVKGQGKTKVIIFTDISSSSHIFFNAVSIKPLRDEVFEKNYAQLIMIDYPLSNEIAAGDQLANMMFCAQAQGKYFELYDKLMTP